MDSSQNLGETMVQNYRRREELDAIKLQRPQDTRIIAVANQKGGVGKTTSTVNLAAALAVGGLRVLVIDIDPQGNATTALGIDRSQVSSSIYEALIGQTSIAQTLRECPQIPNLFVCPSHINLAGAEIELVGIEHRERMLAAAIDELVAQTHFDYILIDCPPSLGIITLNALVAAKEVMIPIQCEYYALEGLSQLLNNVNLIRQAYNPDLYVSTILLTMYDRRTNLSAEVATELRSHFPQVTLQTVIPRSVRVSEAPSFGQTVLTYDPRCSGTIAYREAALEIAGAENE